MKDKHLTMEAQKIVRLVEERGVAAAPYKNVLQKIVAFCETRVAAAHLSNEGEEIEFSVPFEYCKKIAFVEGLKINVAIKNSNNAGIFNRTGGGFATSPSIYVSNSNQQLVNCIIQLNGYAYGGRLLKRTIFGTLCHEINHLYDMWNDAKENEGLIVPRYAATAKRSKAEIGEDENDWAYNLIFYRLFSETELNALVASVYGDLAGMKSVRENFKNDIHSTHAFFVYKQISNVYKKLFSMIDEDTANKIKQIFAAHGIRINPYTNSLQSFKKELIRKTAHCLNKLLNGIGRAASLYYDTTEEVAKLREEKGVITHEDPSINIKEILTLK